MFNQILLLAAAGIALAQDSTVTEAATTITDSTTPSSTSATNTPSGPITHTVAVALGGHTYVPDVTLAEVGDVIQFDFYPTNHSVIRAEYGYPCIPYEDTGIDKIGFFSGFQPVDAILNDPPKWYLTINDTDPVFFYCGALGSCINYQMVGVINPNASTSLVTQKQKAKDSTYMLLPGQPFPSEDQDPVGGGAAASSSTTSGTPTAAKTSAAAPSTSAEASSSHSHGLAAGAIAGIVIGASAVALAAAVLLYFCGRQSLQGRHGPQPQQVPFQPSHMSYVDPNKHMSMYSSVAGPALPGYAPSEHTHGMPSPPLVAYTPSDALNPGNPSTSPAASPNHTAVVPAYSHHAGSMYVNIPELPSLSLNLSHLSPLELGSASSTLKELPAPPFVKSPTRVELPSQLSRGFDFELDSVSSSRKELLALPVTESPTSVELPPQPLQGFDFSPDISTRPFSELPSHPIEVELPDNTPVPASRDTSSSAGPDVDLPILIPPPLSNYSLQSAAVSGRDLPASVPQPFRSSVGLPRTVPILIPAPLPTRSNTTTMRFYASISRKPAPANNLIRQSTPHQSMYSIAGAQRPMSNIHEMAAPVPEGQTQQHTGGILGFIRKSSIGASGGSGGEKGGVERYS